MQDYSPPPPSTIAIGPFHFSSPSWIQISLDVGQSSRPLKNSRMPDRGIPAVPTIQLHSAHVAKTFQFQQFTDLYEFDLVRSCRDQKTYLSDALFYFNTKRIRKSIYFISIICLIITIYFTFMTCITERCIKIQVITYVTNIFHIQYLIL